MTRPPRMHGPLTALSLSLLLSGLTPAGAGDQGPELGTLAIAGQATLKRLEKEAASWTAATQLAGDTRVIVDVVAAPDRRRTILSIEARGRRTEVLRVIVRDGVWYATEGRMSGKYRPYEVPFDLATAYFFLTRSEPQCIVRTEGVSLGAYEGTGGGIAVYRTPITGPMRLRLRSMLDEFEQIRRRNPEEAVRPGMVEPFDRIRELLDKGLPTKVRVATGMIVQFGAADKQTEMHDFRWLDRVDPEVFRIEEKGWEDYTGDPTAKGTSELLMIGHGGTWQPGMKTPDTDGRLLDLRTGRIRRIPFHGSNTVPGCFLRDRRRVVVTGIDAVEGTMGLYEIDLQTGVNRRLGGNRLAGGFTLMPALSPDGMTLAVLHKGATGKMLETQVFLVDLGSGEAKALGVPHDMAFLSWLPGGEGLVALLREGGDPLDLKTPRKQTIVRVDLEGGITKVRNGGFPILLNDGKTVLYEEPTSRTWQTCDLEGGSSKPFAGGLAGHGFPSPAPDGKRIIMMRFRPGQAPEPTILTIGEAEGIPATTAPGLWAAPAWR